MSHSLTIEIDATGRGRIAGRIDVDNAADALSRGIGLFAVGKPLIADISALESADSITLAVLIAWAARARKSGGNLTFKQVSASLQAIAHLGDVESMLGFTAA